VLLVIVLKIVNHAKLTTFLQQMVVNATNAHKLQQVLIVLLVMAIRIVYHVQAD